MITFIPRKQMQLFQKLKQLKAKHVGIIVTPEKEILGKNNNSKFDQSQVHLLSKLHHATLLPSYYSHL